MADYTRQTIEHNDLDGYQVFNTADPTEDDEIAYQHAVGPQPYIPPIAEDPELPNEGGIDDRVRMYGIEALYYMGQPPAKRLAVHNPDYIPLDALRNFTFHDGPIHRDLVLSVHAWCNFEYDNAPNCCLCLR